MNIYNSFHNVFRFGLKITGQFVVILGLFFHKLFLFNPLYYLKIYTTVTLIKFLHIFFSDLEFFFHQFSVTFLFSLVFVSFIQEGKLRSCFPLVFISFSQIKSVKFCFFKKNSRKVVVVIKKKGFNTKWIKLVIWGCTAPGIICNYVPKNSSSKLVDIGMLYHRAF